MDKGRKIDLLIGDGAVQEFRCRQTFRMWLFWLFVAAALVGSVAMAFMKA
jgi:hypothetical protein